MIFGITPEALYITKIRDHVIYLKLQLFIDDNKLNYRYAILIVDYSNKDLDNGY